MPVHSWIFSDASLGSARNHAVPSRQIGLDAVEDLARETAERQQLSERHEVGVGVDLLFLKVGRPDFGALAHQLEVVGGPAAVLHRLEHHAMRGGAERHADQLPLEIGELEVRRVLVDDETVARSEAVVSRNRDEPALAFRVVLEGEAVHHQRIVAHHAELKLVRHHAVGDGRARGEVVPLEFELDVCVLAVLRQVLREQIELSDDDASRDRVGRGVLGADPDRDHGLRAQRNCPPINGRGECDSYQRPTQVPAHVGTSFSADSGLGCRERCKVSARARAILV
jgi:hypothetical protein